MLGYDFHQNLQTVAHPGSSHFFGLKSPIFTANDVLSAKNDFCLKNFFQNRIFYFFFTGSFNIKKRFFCLNYSLKINFMKLLQPLLTSKTGLTAFCLKMVQFSLKLLYKLEKKSHEAKIFT